MCDLLGGFNHEGSFVFAAPFVGCQDMRARVGSYETADR